jgi:hypothetical protein
VHNQLAKGGYRLAYILQNIFLGQKEKEGSFLNDTIKN